MRSTATPSALIALSRSTRTNLVPTRSAPGASTNPDGLMSDRATILSSVDFVHAAVQHWRYSKIPSSVAFPADTRAGSEQRTMLATAAAQLLRPASGRYQDRPVQCGLRGLIILELPKRSNRELPTAPSCLMSEAQSTGQNFLGELPNTSASAPASVGSTTCLPYTTTTSTNNGYEVREDDVERPYIQQ